MLPSNWTRGINVPETADVGSTWGVSYNPGNDYVNVTLDTTPQSEYDLGYFFEAIFNDADNSIYLNLITNMTDYVDCVSTTWISKALKNIYGLLHILKWSDLMADGSLQYTLRQEFDVDCQNGDSSHGTVSY